MHPAGYRAEGPMVANYSLSRQGLGSDSLGPSYRACLSNGTVVPDSL